MQNTIDELVKRYAAGEKISVLEKESGVYRTKITRAIKKKGVPLRGGFSLSPEQEKQITLKYSQGESSEFLAKEYNLSSQSIRKILKRNGGIIRPLGSSCRKYFPDEKYFLEIDREDKAYILGLLYADGCNTNGKIVLALTGSGEKDLLEKIGKLLHPDGRFTLLQDRKARKIIFSGKKFVKTLFDKGVIPRKSLALVFPNQKIVPFAMLRHFVRGYFDGDGCIHLCKRQNSSQVSFVGTFDFLGGIKNFLADNDIFSSILKTKSPSGKVFELKICKRNEIDRLYNLLYKEATIWLERKHEKFLQHLKNGLDIRAAI